jgi:hypothetical protein
LLTVARLFFIRFSASRTTSSRSISPSSESLVATSSSTAAAGFPPPPPPPPPPLAFLAGFLAIITTAGNGAAAARSSTGAEKHAVRPDPERSGAGAATHDAEHRHAANRSSRLTADIPLAQRDLAAAPY